MPEVPEVPFWIRLIVLVCVLAASAGIDRWRNGPHLSCALVHLGEIGYRVGRVLHFDPQSEKFHGDAEANSRLTKEYRDPWTVPDPV